MYRSTQLDLPITHDLPIPHSFVRQEHPTQHLAIVFPGMAYTVHMPVLFYPTQVLLGRGADVLRLDYNFTEPEVKALSKDEQTAWFEAAVDAALTIALAQHAYERITLIGKSIGTLALARCLDHTHTIADARYIWLTPLLRDEGLIDQIKRHPHRALFVIGTEDHEYDPALLAEVQQATNGETVVIDGANHSLQIGSDVIRSLDVMKRVIAHLDAFVA